MSSTFFRCGLLCSLFLCRLGWFNSRLLCSFLLSNYGSFSRFFCFLIKPLFLSVFSLLGFNFSCTSLFYRRLSLFFNIVNARSKLNLRSNLFSSRLLLGLNLCLCFKLFVTAFDVGTFFPHLNINGFLITGFKRAHGFSTQHNLLRLA